MILIWSKLLLITLQQLIMIRKFSLMYYIFKNCLRIPNFNFRNTEPPNYVYHPVNSFHMLERTTFILDFIPKLKRLMPLEFRFDKDSILHDYKRAHHGLADLHEYFNVDPGDIAKGVIKHKATEQVFRSKSPLMPQNMVNIAMEAEGEHYMEGFVNWLTATLKRAETDQSLSKDPLYPQFIEGIQ